MEIQQISGKIFEFIYFLLTFRSTYLGKDASSPFHQFTSSPVHQLKMFRKLIDINIVSTFEMFLRA